jgi:hypothetical protein
MWVAVIFARCLAVSAAQAYPDGTNLVATALFRLTHTATTAHALGLHSADDAEQLLLDTFMQINPPLPKMLYQLTPSRGWAARF